MSDRDKLGVYFEQAAKALLEISRIMKDSAEHARTMNKKEMALKIKQERLEEKSEAVLKDLSKPHPEVKPEILKLIREAKEDL